MNESLIKEKNIELFKKEQLKIDEDIDKISSNSCEFYNN